MIPSPFEWMVALRYLRARRSDGFISIIAAFALAGIALGVAVIIIVMAVMNGFREELLNKILGLNGHASIVGYAGELYDYEPIVAQVRAIPEVTSVTPLVEGQVLATNRGGVASGALVRGIAPETLRAHELVGANIVTGTLEGFGNAPAIAIGDGLARRLGVAAGDRLTLISPQGTATPFGTAPRMTAYVIAATFEVGLYQYDDAFIFMPLDEAQVYFRLPDAVSKLEIFVEEPDRIERTVPALRQITDKTGVVFTWRSLNRQLVSALVVERNVMFLILTLLIVIASFNIISSLIILVKDKARDVAILRTMGATRASMMRIFVMAGASVGLIGTTLGAALGIYVAANIDALRRGLEALTGVPLWEAEIRFLSEMPSKMESGEVTATIVIALLISFLATLPPAWRAARLDPVEVLRYE